MTKRMWVLVADGSGARLFEQSEPGARLAELKDEVLPVGEPTEYADRPGRAHERMGQGRHAMEPHTDLRAQALEKHAHSLGDFLDSTARADRFGRLVIAAPPSLLGHVRKRLSSAVEKRLVGTVAKELMGRQVRELEKDLAEFAHFAPPSTP